jgi:hypothetical protein
MYDAKNTGVPVWENEANEIKEMSANEKVQVIMDITRTPLAYQSHAKPLDMGI